MIGLLRMASLCCGCAVALLLDTSGLAAQTAAPQTPPTDRLILVVGAPGEEAFASEFQQWAREWLRLVNRQNWRLTVIDGEAEQKEKTSSFEALRQAIEAHAGLNERLWIVLIGHGTFARNVAKFNLVGDDVAAKDLAAWLKGIASQVVLVNCSSSSAPFLTELAGRDRVLLTATRAGSEINFSRFGKFFSTAINDLAADIDHDKEVSLLEAFLAATSQTERFYREDARLTTEHALLDDNGDRTGTSGDFYRGIRPAKEAVAGKAIDGLVAGKIILYSAPDAPRFPIELQQRRAEIESQIDGLRALKSTLAAEEYFDRLELLFLQLAEVYDQAESL